jgi:hypothetical protein
MRSSYKILVGKPEGRRPVGRPNVDEKIRLILKIDPKAAGCEVIKGVLVQDRVQ